MGETLLKSVHSSEHFSRSFWFSRVPSNMGELDSDQTIEELSSVTDHLTNNKAPGSDNLSSDLIKKCNSTLLLQLLKFSANAGRKRKSYGT